MPRFGAPTTTAHGAVGADAPPELRGDPEPLVVDWRPEWRASLQDAMHDGVVVVRFADGGLELLKDCRVDGAYQFLPVTREERVVALESADQMSASLPTTGAGLAAKLAGSFARGESYQIALVLIGKRVATIGGTASATPRGPDCGRATHFVRSATVGAFATAMAGKGAVNTAASLFGVGAAVSTASSQSTQVRVGDLDACRAAKGTDIPDQCGAPVYLELRPMSAGAVTGRCPSGFVYSAGKCAKPADVRVHTCLPSDARDCDAQCEAGDGASCRILGEGERQLVRMGMGPAYARYAIDHYARACQLGDAVGCSREADNADKDAIASDARVAAMSKGCEIGDAISCNDLGVRFATGNGVQKDVTRAAPLVARACAGGMAEACVNSGRFYYDGVGVRRDVVRAASGFRAGCEGGAAEGCRYYAEALATGVGVGKNTTKAKELFVKTCSGGEQLACVWLADHYVAGTFGAKDLVAAASLRGEACKIGVARACDSLGLMTLRGEGVAANESAGIALAARACQLEDGHACLRVAQRLRSGDGVPKDAAKAAVVMEASCKLGFGPACESFAFMLIEGEGVKKDPSRALGSLTAGCFEGRRATACLLSGLELRDGQNFSRDLPAAFKLFDKGCSLGDADSCEQAAEAYEDGAGVTKDLARAIELYRRSAESSGRACRALGRIEEAGKSGRVDLRAARVWYRRGCDQGDATSCSYLERLSRAGSGDTRSLEQLGDACAKNEPKACGLLGATYFLGAGVPKNVEKGTSLLRLACEANDAKACVMLASTFTQTDPPRAERLDRSACDAGEGNGCYYASLLVGSRDPAEVVALLDRGCKAKHARSCDALGRRLAYGDGVPKDAARAAIALRRACEVGWECGTLADGYRTGTLGLPRDLARAFAAARRGCDGGSLSSCAMLAQFFQDGAGVPQDLAQAARLFKSTCEQGDRRSCVDFAWAQADGRGVIKDPGAALRRVVALCEGGYIGACPTAGDLQRRGATGSPDYAGAMASYEKACNDKLHSGCVGLGHLYSDGQGVPRDTDRAAAYFKLACDAGNPSACNSLGYAFYFGTSTVPRSFERASREFQRACDAHPTTGCDSLADLYALGEGLPKDEAKAAALYKRSCDAGNDVSCSELAFMMMTGKGTPKDPVAAKRLLVRSPLVVEDFASDCKRGAPRPCTVYALILRSQGNDRGAREALDRACSLGDLWACDEKSRASR